MQLFRTNLVSFSTLRRPLFPKPVSWLALFLLFLTARQLYEQSDTVGSLTWKKVFYSLKFGERKANFCPVLKVS